MLWQEYNIYIYDFLFFLPQTRGCPWQSRVRTCHTLHLLNKSMYRRSNGQYNQCLTLNLQYRPNSSVSQSNIE
ncbi:unnamed protein product [Rotaria magnacalcarata]